MTQILRPNADFYGEGWTDEGTVDNDGNFYTSVDEVTIDNDDSYIQRTSTELSGVELGLASGDDPGVDTGHVLHVFFRTIGSGGPEKIDFSLVQGTTLIEEFTNETNRSDNYADINQTITNASAITDYSALRIRIYASTIGNGEQVRVTQAYLEIPDASSFQAAWAKNANQLIGG